MRLAIGVVSAMLAWSWPAAAGAVSFAPATNYGDTSAAAGVDIAAGDLGLDGDRDLVVAAYNLNEVLVFRNTGLGVFVGPQHVPVGGNPRSVAVVDVVGDSRRDIIVTNDVIGTVTLVRNTPLRFAIYETVRDVGLNPTSVTLVDVDGDGGVDLLTGDGDQATGAPTARAHTTGV